MTPEPSGVRLSFIDSSPMLHQHDRLDEIDRFPITEEGRALARIAALLNDAGIVVSPEERERIGNALSGACHRARVPTGRLRRLVDPEAAAFVRSVTDFMRPPD